MTAGQIYSTTADTLSILGFGITFWVLWVTTRLRKEFLNRVRLPEMHADLERYSGELITAMNARDSATTLTVCSKTQATLEMLKLKIENKHNPRIDQLLAKLSHVLATRNATIATVQPVYDGILGLLELMSQLQKDANWSVK